MLFLAAIDKRPITLVGLPSSSDVQDMIVALKTLGLKIKSDKNTVTILNSFPDCEELSDKPLVVKCGYGGTTTRFLAALLALGKRRYYLEAEGYMRSRPMSEIVKPLTELGVEAIYGSEEAWLVINGPVKNKVNQLDVDASRSTQFASALAMTVSTWNGEVNPIGMNASEDYFAMTLDCIKHREEATWRVPVDFSSLSYPIALAAISGQVLVRNVHSIDYQQPDSILLTILEQMGAEVDLSNDGLKVKNMGRLKPWSGDCAGFPDLVPTLALLCAYADGVSHLKNLDVLRHKECDRFYEVIKILKLFGINIKNDDDDYIITGRSDHIRMEVSYKAPDDHRMIMVAALFMRLNGGGKIENWNHVKKSYVEFFTDVADH